jgi:hypothetical protein
VWDTEAPVEYEVAEEDAERTAIITLPAMPDEPLLPVAVPPGGNGGSGPAAARRAPASPAAAAPAGGPHDGAGLTFDDPSMDWSRDDDPFAGLGPVDPEGTDDARPRGSGGIPRRR